MGTNFYVRGWEKRDLMEPQYHIGKRSAAGYYCWDCGVTLCRGGNAKIHKSSDWYSACPKCGKKPQEEGLFEGAAGRELGFNKEPSKRKTGVASCSSFTWATAKEKFLNGRRIVFDEYGRSFSWDEFLAILEECPVQYHHMVGEWFS